MKQRVRLQIVVEEPLAGVSMMIQLGRDELLHPVRATRDALTFELEIDVDLTGATPNFLGRFAQGPKDARFIYVNSGTYAGSSHSCWSRRAKVSLMSITREQIEKAVSGNAVIETSFSGIGKDGGPTCASVKGIEWKVVSR